MIRPETLETALHRFRTHPVQMGLTLGGLIVGTAAIIVIVALGLTGRAFVMAQIEGVGSHLVWGEYEGTVTSGVSRRLDDQITEADVKAIAAREDQPVTDELLQPRRHAEVLTKDGRQSVGISNLSDQRADMKQFRNIGDAVAVSQRSRGDADEGADVGQVMILVSPITIDVRLCLRPCAVEERKESMMKNIEEPAERAVARIAQPIARVLGQVRRQRTIRPEQPEQPHLKPWLRGARFGSKPRQGRRGRYHVNIHLVRSNSASSSGMALNRSATRP